MPAQVIDLTNLAAEEGFIVQGDAAGDQAGFSVSNAGDVNGDGIDDLIVGALYGDDGGTSAGEAYVIFGRATGFGVDVSGRQVLGLISLSASDGFIIQGDATGDQAGFSVSNAGDVNGDGIADLIVGANAGDDGGTNAGEAYVIFGRTTGFGVDVSGRQVIDLTSLSASDGFIIQGDAANDLVGRSVSNAGDVNGDGIDDLIVGADRGDDGGFNAGEAYVIFGRTSGFGVDVSGRQVIDLTSLSASDGFIIQGDETGDYAGASVSNAGDVNGDGIDDLIVGATGGDDGSGTYAGEAYVIFGRTSGFGVNVSGRQVIDLTSLSASDGFIIQGDAADDRAGRSVSNAGDVNGDGIDDLIVGAYFGDDDGSNAGEAYVIFGRTTGFGVDVSGRQVIDLTSLSASDGFIIQGDAAGDRTGRSVSTAGDVNGDGIDDLIVGAYFGDDDGSNAGEAYVIFGRTTGFGVDVSGRQVIDLTSLSASDGFIIQGDAAGDQAGVSVSAAGDVDGDGIDDLIVGASGGDDGGSNAGEAYVIFGSRQFGAINGTAAGETLTGTAGSDVINGLGGNDVLDGGAGGDDLSGGTGNDIYVVDDGGDDVLEAADEGTDSVETVLVAYALRDNVENLEFTGVGDFNGTGNALANIIVGGASNDMMSGDDGDDTLSGEAGDDMLGGNNGNDRLFGGTGADTMNGDAGNDRLIVDNVGDVANGGDGIDTVEISAAGLSYTVTGDVEIIRNISGGDLTITLNALANTFGGSATGNDFVAAGDGQDSIYGRGGSDTLFGQGGNDFLFGDAGDDGLSGGDGVDRLYGGADNDTISGGIGNDVLYGEAGSDLLIGGTGSDQLFGGAGADNFQFFAGDSSNDRATADRIFDYNQAQGDALTFTAGTSFIGSAAFGSVAGQIRFEQAGGNTFVEIDIDGNGVADQVVRIDGLVTLTGSDFTFG